MKIEFKVENDQDAIKLLVAYVKKCLLLGGLPLIRTRYGGIPLEENDKIGVIALCYAPLLAKRVETLDIYVDKKSEDWKYLWKHIDTYLGDWREIIGRYGFLVKKDQVDEILERYGVKIWYKRKLE